MRNLEVLPGTAGLEDLGDRDEDFSPLKDSSNEIRTRSASVEDDQEDPSKSPTQNGGCKAITRQKSGIYF